MSKRLPYFQFEPGHYLAGNIMFCSLASQGLFVGIMAIFWQKDCSIKKDQILKRFPNPELLQELLENNVIKLDGENIRIDFLEEQYKKFSTISSINSENGKSGAKKRWGSDSGRYNSANSETIASPEFRHSETMALREDKIREEEIREDNKIKENLDARKSRFLENLNKFVLTDENDVKKDFIEYWTESSLNGKKMRFEKEKVFDVSRRWNTWIKNNKNWKNGKQSNIEAVSKF